MEGSMIWIRIKKEIPVMTKNILGLIHAMRQQPMVLSPRKANGFNWSVENKKTEGRVED